MNIDNKKPEKVLRTLGPEEVELRITDKDDPKITGYAAKFSKWSLDLGGFREKVRKGAFDEAIEKSDVRALKNHDRNLLLGRTSSGTLRLKINSVGLGFEIDPPNTTTGSDTIEEIRRGDLSGCSFAFTVVEDDWKYPEEGPIERTIIKVGEIFDVGPVTYPAYPDTTVAARSTEMVKQLTEQRQNEEIEEKKKTTYECECIECGHTDEFEEHCKDIKCPECGGEMRRKQRPGPGRSQELEDKTADEPKEISAERKRKCARGYRRAVRIIERNKKLIGLCEKE